jgi:hypothetical protein
MIFDAFGRSAEISLRFPSGSPYILKVTPAFADIATTGTRAQTFVLTADTTNISLSIFRGAACVAEISRQATTFRG